MCFHKCEMKHFNQPSIMLSLLGQVISQCSVCLKLHTNHPAAPRLSAMLRGQLFLRPQACRFETHGRGQAGPCHWAVYLYYPFKQSIYHSCPKPDHKLAPKPNLTSHWHDFAFLNVWKEKNQKIRL